MTLRCYDTRRGAEAEAGAEAGAGEGAGAAVRPGALEHVRPRRGAHVARGARRDGPPPPPLLRAPSAALLCFAPLLSSLSALLMELLARPYGIRSPGSAIVRCPLREEKSYRRIFCLIILTRIENGYFSRFLSSRAM